MQPNQVPQVSAAVAPTAALTTASCREESDSLMISAVQVLAPVEQHRPRR